jgi:hypothetical protein
LRELVRYRTSLIRERAFETNRIAKVLEGTNLKLGSVSTNIGGVSGRAILTALVENTTDPEVLAELARGRLRNKHEALVAALSGRVGAHQRFLLAVQLRPCSPLAALGTGSGAPSHHTLPPRRCTTAPDSFWAGRSCGRVERRSAGERTIRNRSKSALETGVPRGLARVVAANSATVPSGPSCGARSTPLT